MEKRKVFKISIIDKEISRTEFDRNTFYTSDSELTLVFKLIEKDYSYDHGEIILYNENDKSFVTRPITKQDNDFVYELDLDIIPHYGTWKAQLQLVNEGDVYTSKPFDFVIENDLSNLAPQPTLTDINNWATLKQSANELIDEMKDVIVGVERAESERASKENKRQQAESERVNNEQGRKNSEFTRENQENERKQAESERENNEKKRRIAEFERVDKETTRQQAEQERQRAELIRVENELLRVERDTKRETEITDIKDDILNFNTITLTNEIENGDFSDGTSGWTSELGTLDVKDGIATVKSNGIHKIQRLIRYGVVLNNNEKYYFNANFRYVSEDYTSLQLQFYRNLSSTSPSTTLSSVKSGSTSWLFENTFETGQYRLTIAFMSEPISSNNRFETSNVTLLNLTKIFGAGNEPTKEVMDWIISRNGYFDELTLIRDDIQQYEINQLRKAVLALGGTI